ncbi:uncharacterized protein LOC119689434 isoform X3 [Teleopsis dalmanni]|uniref:uncharacterized protein LOC119689434 isoform X3 n=1 Tax=Teleopsis dalmanni TaxID=139649 RepID=UPI0018CDDF6E|nr:uncharacterized protein LOC119689434 isoform X3 [Teleopsis dalmanni]
MENSKDVYPVLENSDLQEFETVCLQEFGCDATANTEIEGNNNNLKNRIMSLYDVNTRVEKNVCNPENACTDIEKDHRKDIQTQLLTEENMFSSVVKEKYHNEGNEDVSIIYVSPVLNTLNPQGLGTVGVHQYGCNVTTRTELKRNVCNPERAGTALKKNDHKHIQTQLSTESSEEKHHNEGDEYENSVSEQNDKSNILKTFWDALTGNNFMRTYFTGNSPEFERLNDETAISNTVNMRRSRLTDREPLLYAQEKIRVINRMHLSNIKKMEENKILNLDPKYMKTYRGRLSEFSASDAKNELNSMRLVTASGEELSFKGNDGNGKSNNQYVLLFRKEDESEKNRSIIETPQQPSSLYANISDEHISTLKLKEFEVESQTQLKDSQTQSSPVMTTSTNQCKNCGHLDVELIDQYCTTSEISTKVLYKNPNELEYSDDSNSEYNTANNSDQTLEEFKFFSDSSSFTSRKVYSSNSQTNTEKNEISQLECSGPQIYGKSESLISFKDYLTESSTSIRTNASNNSVEVLESVCSNFTLSSIYNKNESLSDSEDSDTISTTTVYENKNCVEVLESVSFKSELSLTNVTELMNIDSINQGDKIIEDEAKTQYVKINESDEEKSNMNVPVANEDDNPLFKKLDISVSRRPVCRRENELLVSARKNVSCSTVKGNDTKNKKILKTENNSCVLPTYTKLLRRRENDPQKAALDNINKNTFTKGEAANNCAKNFVPRYPNYLRHYDDPTVLNKKKRKPQPDIPKPSQLPRYPNYLRNHNKMISGDNAKLTSDIPSRSKHLKFNKIKVNSKLCIKRSYNEKDIVPNSDEDQQIKRVIANASGIVFDIVKLIGGKPPETVKSHDASVKRTQTPRTPTIPVKVTEKQKYYFQPEIILKYQGRARDPKRSFNATHLNELSKTKPKPQFTFRYKAIEPIVNSRLCKSTRNTSNASKNLKVPVQFTDVKSRVLSDRIDTNAVELVEILTDFSDIKTGTENIDLDDKRTETELTEIIKISNGLNTTQLKNVANCYSRVNNPKEVEAPITKVMSEDFKMFSNTDVVKETVQMFNARFALKTKPTDQLVMESKHILTSGGQEGLHIQDKTTVNTDINITLMNVHTTKKECQTDNNISLQKATVKAKFATCDAIQLQKTTIEGQFHAERSKSTAENVITEVKSFINDSVVLPTTILEGQFHVDDGGILQKQTVKENICTGANITLSAENIVVSDNDISFQRGTTTLDLHNDNSFKFPEVCNSAKFGANIALFAENMVVPDNNILNDI